MALPPDMIEEYYNNTSKCTINWILVKIVNNEKTNDCIQDIELVLKNEKWYFKAKTVFNNWECILDTYHEQFFSNDLKIWNKYSFVLDDKFNILIKIIDTKNIKTCVWNEVNYKENLNNYYIFFSLFFIIILIWVFFFKLLKSKKSKV